jgi:hypothetical protein
LPHLEGVLRSLPRLGFWAGRGQGYGGNSRTWGEIGKRCVSGREEEARINWMV